MTPLPLLLLLAAVCAPAAAGPGDQRPVSSLQDCPAGPDSPLYRPGLRSLQTKDSTRMVCVLASWT